MKLTFTAAVLMIVLSPACRVIDLRVDPARTGVDSDALIEGYATVGFADDPSFLRVDVLDGNSAGSIFYFELWYLLRLEVGLVGASVGVLPFDVGIGTLFYHPRSPSAPHFDQHDEWDLDAPGHGHGGHGHHGWSITFGEEGCPAGSECSPHGDQECPHAVDVETASEEAYEAALGDADNDDDLEGASAGHGADHDGASAGQGAEGESDPEGDPDS